MNIMALNSLALDLVARDFSDGHMPTNGGPTKTSRALAIIHLAARDAYAKVTGSYPAKLTSLPNKPAGLSNDDATGTAAMLAAGLRAAALLYPDFASHISTQRASLIPAGANASAVTYGDQIGQQWVSSRVGDKSELPQEDTSYNPAPGHHRPDPLAPGQKALGRNWGQVTPFVLTNVATDAPLGPCPPLVSPEYAKSFKQVYSMGRNNTKDMNPSRRRQSNVGIFWGYDGANKLGTPPRLYNQIVISAQEFKDQNHAGKINILAAINAAMADAGIAAWHWKYVYDFWRPVIGVREADAEWGPSGIGDGNKDTVGDPFWLPLGAPRSNPHELKVGAAGRNFTPNFPAYPSGHATFGSACFETFAALVGKKTSNIQVTFTSDEFNGITTDNEGAMRPHWTQKFTLSEGIAQNNISRIYLGVHWDFDATGGETVGKAVAKKVVQAFKP